MTDTETMERVFVPLTDAPLDIFHWHEMMDRINMLAEMWDAHVINHPSAVVDPALFQTLSHVAEMMANTYQIAANLRFDFEEKEQR